jgi:hypothetical protein
MYLQAAGTLGLAWLYDDRLIDDDHRTGENYLRGKLQGPSL